jgi:Na+/pantothenate symporter
MGKVCSPAPRARETLSAHVGGSVGVLNLGYAWWLLTAVIVVFAALFWYILGGW